MRSPLRFSGFLLLTILVFCVSIVAAQPAPLRSGYIAASGRSIIDTPYGTVARPGDMTALWNNPAGIGYEGYSTLTFFKPSSLKDIDGFYGRDFGVGFNAGGFAFGHQSTNDSKTRLYSVGFGFPVSDDVSVGASYHWNKGLKADPAYDVGFLYYPWFPRWGSFEVGATMINALGGTPANNSKSFNPTYRLGTALYLFRQRLVITADATLWKNEHNNYTGKLDPTLGIEVRALRGLYLRGGYSWNTQYAYAGISIDLGNLQVGQHSGFAVGSGDRGDGGAGWATISTDYRPSILE